MDRAGGSGYRTHSLRFYGLLWQNSETNTSIAHTQTLGAWAVPRMPTAMIDQTLFGSTGRYGWHSRMLSFEESAGQFLGTRPSREHLGHLKPTSVVAHAVVLTHARALALVPRRVLARRSADLLLTIGLDDVHASKPLKAPIHEVVEPRLWDLPALFFDVPLRDAPPLIPEPAAVGLVEWQPYPEPFAFACPPQHHWNRLLIPDVAKTAVGLSIALVASKRWHGRVYAMATDTMRPQGRRGTRGP